jgi:hypothetical protein
LFQNSPLIYILFHNFLSIHMSFQNCLPFLRIPLLFHRHNISVDI